MLPDESENGGSGRAILAAQRGHDASMTQAGRDDEIDAFRAGAGAKQRIAHEVRLPNEWFVLAAGPQQQHGRG